MPPLRPNLSIHDAFRSMVHFSGLLHFTVQKAYGDANYIKSARGHDSEPQNVKRRLEGDPHARELSVSRRGLLLGGPSP